MDGMRLAALAKEGQEGPRRRNRGRIVSSLDVFWGIQLIMMRSSC